jgi:hypothetical protein
MIAPLDETAVLGTGGHGDIIRCACVRCFLLLYLKKFEDSTMKIVFDSRSGTYFAFCKAGGKPCLGFSKSRVEAMNFCYELVREADTSALQKKGVS